MDNFIFQIFNLLVLPPGNLLYHLVIAFSIGIALQTHLVLSQSQAATASRRMTLGLTLLLVIQIVLFIISGLNWQGLVNAQVILPPLDRAVTAFSLIWIIWLWVFPKPLRVADSLVILFNLVIAVSLAFTLAFWAAESTTGFNNGGLDLAWELFSLVMILTGSALILTRRPAGWPIGLGMLAILLTGVLFQIFVFIPGDYPGFIRLAQLAAFPLLTTLVQQAAAQPETYASPAWERRSGTGNEKAPVKERRRYSADPKTVHAFLNLAVEGNPKNMVSSVTRAIGQAMLADLCLLITPPDLAGRLTILGGYDLIREENLEGCPLDRADVPMLATAIQKGRPLRLAATHDATPDINTLYEVIGISHPGNLLAVPMLGQNKSTLGAIILLSPYANRVWSTDDQTYLTNTADQLAAILYRPLPSQATPTASQVLPNKLPNEIERLKTELDVSQQQVQQMERVQKDLTEQLISVQQRASSSSQNETLQALMEVQEEAQDLIVQLQCENEKLRRDISQAQAYAAASGLVEGEIPPDIQYLEGELRKALADAAQVQNTLAASNARMFDLEKQLALQSAPSSPGVHSASPLEELITAIMMVIQELRRPVNAMVSQVDHLIQNPPSAAQDNPSKNLEQIKASVERILGLLDNLMEIVASPRTTVDLNPEPIDVPGLIDQVIGATTVEFREKNLSLQVDLPEKLPPLKADLQTTQKTLVLLLHNAGEVTPAGGAVRIKVSLQGEALEDQYFLYQVTDSGGGINSADLPRLFSRFESAGEQVIKGLGAPNSVAEARDLVEAQNGRIWVDTEPGSTTTLSFLLPLQQPNFIKDLIDE